jgi:hypothetical protein
MTRDAVREQMRLVSEAVGKGCLDRLSPSNAAGLWFVPSAVDSAVLFFLGEGMKEKTAQQVNGYERGLKASLDYAEEEALGGGSFGKYEGEILGSDGWYACYEGDEEDGFGDAVVERYRRLGEDLAPLVASSEDGFWDAALDVYGKERAVETVDRLTGYAETIEPYADGFTLGADLGPWTVDFADEALRALRETENDVRERMVAKADSVY